MRKSTPVIELMFGDMDDDELNNSINIGSLYGGDYLGNYKISKNFSHQISMDIYNYGIVKNLLHSE